MGVQLSGIMLVPDKYQGQTEIKKHIYLRISCTIFFYFGTSGANRQDWVVNFYRDWYCCSINWLILYQLRDVIVY